MGGHNSHAHVVENSRQPVGQGKLSFGIETDTLNLGSIKAVFWLIMALVLPVLFSGL